MISAPDPPRPGRTRSGVVIGATLAVALVVVLAACARPSDVIATGSTGTGSTSTGSAATSPIGASDPLPSVPVANGAPDSRALLHELLQHPPVEATRTQSDLPQQSSRSVIFDEATIGVLGAAAPEPPTATADYDQIWIDGRHFQQFRSSPGAGSPGGFEELHEVPPLGVPFALLFPELALFEQGFALTANPRCAPGEYGHDLPDRAVVCVAVDAAGALQRVTGVFPNPSTPDFTTTITFSPSSAPPLRAPTPTIAIGSSFPPIGEAPQPG